MRENPNSANAAVTILRTSCSCGSSTDSSIHADSDSPYHPAGLLTGHALRRMAIGTVIQQAQRCTRMAARSRRDRSGPYSPHPSRHDGQNPDQGVPRESSDRSACMVRTQLSLVTLRTHGFRLINPLKNIRFARVKPALNSSDNPIGFTHQHSTLKGLNFDV